METKQIKMSVCGINIDTNSAADGDIRAIYPDAESAKRGLVDELRDVADLIESLDVGNASSQLALIRRMMLCSYATFYAYRDYVSGPEK